MTLPGFTTPAESQALAGKVIDMISHFKGTRAEIKKLKRYLRNSEGSGETLTPQELTAGMRYLRGLDRSSEYDRTQAMRITALSRRFSSLEAAHIESMCGLFEAQKRRKK
ncbi:hypothetical protein KAR91_69145 [Candidatus Pacearchaeota archaeon]|nr:hypothetical protein [Candidatus Pacearchaeota archaeon]